MGGGTHFVNLFFGDLFFLSPQKSTFQHVSTPIQRHLSVAILAAVSDLLYLPPILGKLILYKSPAVACETRKTSAFDLRRALRLVYNKVKTSLKPMFDQFLRDFCKCIGTNQFIASFASATTKYQYKLVWSVILGPKNEHTLPKTENIKNELVFDPYYFF